MSLRLRNAALFAFVALLSCLYFLAQDRGGRVGDNQATALEPQPRPTRRPLPRPVAVVVAPRLTQNASDQGELNPIAARNRSFYNLPTAPAFASEAVADAPQAPDIFPLANPDANVEISAQFSVWAKFPVGSWSRLRVVTQTNENGKKLESVTETRATLVSVDFEKKRYALRYDSTIKMGGVDHQKNAEMVEYNFWDLVAVANEREEERPAVNLVIGDRVAPCRVKQLTREFDHMRETVVVWRSPAVAQGAIQRETIRTRLDAGKDGKELLSRELFVVQRATAATPLTPATREARFSKSAAGRETTGASVYSSAIPGGLTREVAVEVESENGEPLKSETTLLDYYVAH